MTPLYWAYGFDDGGTPQLKGPFGSHDDAEEGSGDLSEVRIVAASSREAAINQLQRQPTRRRLRSDEPRREKVSDAIDSMDSEYDDFDKELQESNRAMEF